MSAPPPRADELRAVARDLLGAAPVWIDVVPLRAGGHRVAMRISHHTSCLVHQDTTLEQASEQMLQAYVIVANELQAMLLRRLQAIGPVAVPTLAGPVHCKGCDFEHMTGGDHVAAHSCGRKA